MKNKIFCDNVNEKLSCLIAQVKLGSKSNLHDNNIHAESFFRDFLNELYGWKLINSNLSAPNTAGFDLIDSDNRILVQVSSDSERDKIQESLNKSSSYSGWKFIFVAITDTEPRWKRTIAKNPFETKELQFNPECDFITVGNIVDQVVKDCDIDIQHHLSDLVDKYFSSKELSNEKPIVQFVKKHKFFSAISIIGLFAIITVIFFFAQRRSAKKDVPTLDEESNYSSLRGSGNQISASETSKSGIQTDKIDLSENDIANDHTESQDISSREIQEEAMETASLPVKTEFEWLSYNDSRIAIDSKMETRKQEYYLAYGEVPDNTVEEYAILLATFFNQDNYDLLIDKCTIQINDIQEIKAPFLTVNCRLSYSHDYLPGEEPCIMEVYNGGWGKAENITIRFMGLQGFDFDEEAEILIPAEQFLLPGTKTQFSVQCLEPGQRSDGFAMFCLNQIMLDKLPKTMLSYYPVYEISTESGYYQDSNPSIMWDIDEEKLTDPELYPWAWYLLHESELGHGDDDDEPPAKQFACVINTAIPSYHQTFSTKQRIPAGSFVTLPICIAPVRSCSFTITISFHFLGDKGDEALSTPEEHMVVFVPNYDGERENIADGSSDEWKDLKDNFIVYFPYQTYD